MDTGIFKLMDFLAEFETEDMKWLRERAEILEIWAEEGLEEEMIAIPET